MCDAHYSHLLRLVDHKSTHKLPLRTYIPSYLLKCLKFLFLFNNVRISCYSNVLTLYIFLVITLACIYKFLLYIFTESN